jgi:hypothetical protein
MAQRLGVFANFASLREQSKKIANETTINSGLLVFSIDTRHRH